MKTIELTKGYSTSVDDEDYEILVKYLWYALTTGKSDVVYAARTSSVREGRKVIMMHKQILGVESQTLVDHADRNGLNNSRRNLRVADKSKNSANSRARLDTNSGFRGVRRIGNRWYAEIQVLGKRFALGGHASALEAAIAYDRKAIEAFGDFASLNVISRGGK